MRRPLLSFLSVLVVAGGGCLARPIEPNEPTTSQTFTDSSGLSAIDKIDLLLAIDNSGSMADKQDILAHAVPDLVRGLLNPKCVDKNGVALPANQQPASPLDACPAHSGREFTPIVDVHVGIVTSSFKEQCQHAFGTAEEDQGLLQARTLPGVPAVTTSKNEPFLDWDPNSTGKPSNATDLGQFEEDLGKIVRGANEDGCGFEAQLESWYRFLVDPTADKDVIDQRAEFLRPDSLVAVVLLSDENDCSVDARYIGDHGGGSILDVESGVARKPPTVVCKTDPQDPCCAPCGDAPSDCPAAKKACEPELDVNTTDKENLRCFDQKRRFGKDYLYPVQRYIDGLTQAQVVGSDGKTYANPLFPGTSKGPTGRVPEASLVYFAGIVGVPWEDIARKTGNKPDLLSGADESGDKVGGFQNASELALKSGPWGSTWDLILGDPSKNVAPADKLMVEQEGKRTGTDPATGDALAPPEATSPTANPINGHEWHAEATQQGDLQYACIFPLQTPIVCDDDLQNCDCGDLDNPLCQKDDGTYGTTQLRAKAYPGTRQLQVLKGIGAQGIVASICPATLADTEQGKIDYGYEPAVGAIVERLKARLANACLPIALEPQKDGSFPCLVLEGHLDDTGCDCAKPARTKVDPSSQAVQQVPNHDAFACFCAITQLDGNERKACQSDADPNPTVSTSSGDESVDGWCYVDPNDGLGNPEIVKLCPTGQKRELRFVGAGKAAPKTSTFITCAAEK